MIGQYLKGMLCISVEGVNLERFMNRCSENGISLYYSYRKKYDYLECSILLSDFRRIAALNKELRCRIRVRKRFGLRFFFNRLFKRKTFVFGSAMFVLLLVILSSTVWRIDVTGIDRITATQIISVINEQKCGIGTFSAHCDTRALELAIIKALPDVDWVIVDINGVVMDVRVIETVENIERKKNTPSRILSEVSGTIEYVNAIRGNALVSAGSVVKPGDILIDGVCRNKRDDTVSMVINSYGIVKARVDYCGKAEIKLSDVDSKSFTGKTERHLEITVFGHTFGKKESSFENCDTSVEEYNLFSEGRLFPVVARAVTYSEYEPLSEKEVREKALDELFRKAYNDAVRHIPIDADIVSRDVNYTYDKPSGTLSAVASVTAVHNIGITENITKDEIKSLLGDKNG